MYGVVAVSFSEKYVTIEYDEDKVSLDDIKLTIEDQGYDIV